MFGNVLFKERGKPFWFKDGKWLKKESGDLRVHIKHHEEEFPLLMPNGFDMKMCFIHLILTSLEFKSQSFSNSSVTLSTEADFSLEEKPKSTSLVI